jgi:predicted metalloprotease with PDZ domain
MRIRISKTWLLRVVALGILVVAANMACSAECRFAPDGPGRMLTYRFDPQVSDTATILHVTLTFQGNAAGAETIELPDHWGDGAARRAMSNLHPLSDGTSLSTGPTADSEIVRYTPNAPVVVGYDLAKDWTGAFLNPLQFHPVVMAEYIEINGSNGLVHPKLNNLDPVTVHFDWRELPAGWTLASSFGASQDAAERCQSYTGTWEAVDRALFAAGDFRLRRFEVHGQPVVLAIRGQWTFTDDEAVATLRKVMGVVRDFWQDYDFSYFLVTLKPYDVDHGTSDGSAYTNAFWMYMSRLDPLSGVLPTLAHEHFHAWNTPRMGEETEGQAKIDWFHEGFTDYYGNTLVYQAGLVTLPDYLRFVNRDLRDYPASTSPYVRGSIIALWLDAEISKESDGKSSLRNVMLDMVRHRNEPLVNSRILATIDHYLSPELGAQLQDVVEHGVVPQLPTGALGPCARLSIDEVATFDLGFDYDASKAAGKIIGVRTAGPAFTAGLRDGQLLIKKSVWHDQPDKQVVFT